MENLSRRFNRDGLAAVEDVSFSMVEGELLALLGPSGCGKTTTLRMIGGFERPDTGRIRLNTRDITDLAPEKRDIGIVFQDYALFPHLNVLENVMFGLSDHPAAPRRAKAMEMLELVSLTHFAQRMPHQLSGGQQQRVALARTLARRPRLLLLDEPFSNLDAGLREETRQEVRGMLKAAGSAVILVTHDQEEAMAFSDTLAIMRDGRIEQLGFPHAVYRRPETEFVARFLGRANILSGMAEGRCALTAAGRLELDRPETGPVTLAVRPEQFTLTPDPNSDTVVVDREFRGSELFYWLLAGEQRLTVLRPSRDMLAVGTPVRLGLTEPAVIIPARSSCSCS